MNSNLSTEFQQFHSYIRHKFSANKLKKLDSVILKKVIVEDYIECAFHKLQSWTPFSQMKRIKKSKQNDDERLEFLSLRMIEAYLLRQINFKDLIKDVANKKCRIKLFRALFWFFFKYWQHWLLLKDTFVSISVCID